jgi:hypothetical protein
MQIRFDEDHMAQACLVRPEELPAPQSRAATAKAGPASALRIEAVANSIALTLIATFVVTLAYLYWKHKGPELPPPASPSIAVPQAAPVLPQAAPAVRRASPTRAASRSL